MREGLVFEQIFPIGGPASAKLMRLKADCLLRAGVIDAAERDVVYACSAGVLGFAAGWAAEPETVAPGLMPDLPREPFAAEAAHGGV
jgi:hypothetical protein